MELLVHKNGFWICSEAAVSRPEGGKSLGGAQQGVLGAVPPTRRHSGAKVPLLSQSVCACYAFWRGITCPWREVLSVFGEISERHGIEAGSDRRDGNIWRYGSGGVEKRKIELERLKLGECRREKLTWGERRFCKFE